MATNIFSKITVKAIEGLFIEVMGKAPNIFRNHCMVQDSSAPQETYSWLGTLPVPRLFLDGRSFQGIREFTITLVNDEYEMSFIVDQVSLEDDSLSQVNNRIREVAEVWATFEDSLFSTLIEAGQTSTDTFDGTAYHADTRVIGVSANIDNNLAATPVDATFPTASEVGGFMQSILASMWVFNDDQGRPVFNAQAMDKIRVIIHPQYQKGFVEFAESTLLSNSDNPWGKNLYEIDVLPYLTASDESFYTSAVGATRMPFVFQERIALDLTVFNGVNEIADNRGLKILSRKRLKFGYGDPRRNVVMALTDAS